MPPPLPRRYLPLAVGAVLAPLQYRWIGQVSELESHRLRSSLSAAGNSFAEDFDREIARAFLLLRPEWLVDGPDLAPRIAQHYQRWLVEAPYPGLIGQILYIHAGEHGAPTLAVLRTNGPRFEAIAWPGELAARRRGLAGEGAERFRRLPTLMADPPGLALPVVSKVRRVRLREEPGALWRGDFVLVRLDEPAMVREILPAMTRRHFGSVKGTEHVLAVLTRDEPARVVFLSDPRLAPRALRAADLALPLFSLRLAELRSL